jgi:hypothetical protein
MQKADLVGQAIEIADEIGKHAVDACLSRVELLMLACRQEEVEGVGGKFGMRPHEIAKSGIGQIAVDPHPAVIELEPGALGHLLRGPVGAEVKRADEPGDGALRRFRDRRRHNGLPDRHLR